MDPHTGRPAAEPVRLATGDVLAHTLAVGGGRVTVTATVGARPPELCVVDPSGSIRPLTTTGSSWIDGIAWPHMRCVDAPGPGGPIETWIASPAGASDSEVLPTVVDVHGGPLGAWSPAPSLEVVLLCARGYRVVLPNIRGSCSYGAAWITPQLVPGAARMRRTSTRRWTMWCGSVLRTLKGWGRSVSRTAGSWSTGSSAPRTGSGRRCPRTA